MECEKCMKCGREIKSGQVFCEGCLDEMEKYPVKPGIVVLLPHRPPQTQKANTRRRHPAVPLEEQVKKLKKRMVVLSCALALSVAATAGLCWLWVAEMLEEDKIEFLPGQNYSSASSTPPSETEGTE